MVVFALFVLFVFVCYFLPAAQTKSTLAMHIGSSNTYRKNAEKSEIGAIERKIEGGCVCICTPSVCKQSRGAGVSHSAFICVAIVAFLLAHERVVLITYKHTNIQYARRTHIHTHSQFGPFNGKKLLLNGSRLAFFHHI